MKQLFSKHYIFKGEIVITTLNKIREHSPCAPGWAELLKHLGKHKADDEPLSIGFVLDSNGLNDAIWCLRAVDGVDREIRLYAVWCARQVQHLMTDPRSIAALDAAERFANGDASKDEMDAASAAASAAASDVSWTAASAASWAAASAASSAVSWAAASAASSAAASDASWAASWAAAAAADANASWAAASAASSAAAREAARGAAREAASASARAAQEKELRAICARTELAPLPTGIPVL